MLLQVGRCQIRDTSANLHVFARMCVYAGIWRSLRVLNRGAPGRRNVDEPVCDRSTSGMQLLGSKSVHLLHHIAKVCAGYLVGLRAARCLEKNRKPRSRPGSEIIKVCPRASVMIGYRAPRLDESVQLYRILFFFFSFPLPSPSLLYLCERILLLASRRVPVHVRSRKSRPTANFSSF